MSFLMAAGPSLRILAYDHGISRGGVIASPLRKLILVRVPFTSAIGGASPEAFGANSISELLLIRSEVQLPIASLSLVLVSNSKLKRVLGKASTLPYYPEVACLVQEVTGAVEDFDV
jgi:hypothetical protein